LFSAPDVFGSGEGDFKGCTVDGTFEKGFVQRNAFQRDRVATE
jgi:hypothetical protein